MTIIQRIAQCDNGTVAAWENKANGKRMEVRRSIFWTKRYPNYVTMYFSNGVLVTGSNGLTRQQAVRAVSCWLNRGGNE